MNAKESKRRSGQKYAELLCDFMFKRLFGSEANKDVLIGFLNMILEDARIPDRHAEFCLFLRATLPFPASNCHKYPPSRRVSAISLCDSFQMHYCKKSHGRVHFLRDFS